MEATFVTSGLVSLIFFYPSSTLADISGLLPCGDSSLFTKQLDQKIQQLIIRLSKYDSGNPDYINFKDQIEQTKDRFYAYSHQKLLCAEEGLPHLMVGGVVLRNLYLLGITFFIYFWVDRLGRT